MGDRAQDQRLGFPVSACLFEERPRAGDRLRDGGGSVQGTGHERGDEARLEHAIPGATCVQDHLLGCRLGFSVPPVRPVHERDQPPCPRQALLMLERLEDRDGLGHDAEDLALRLFAFGFVVQPESRQACGVREPRFT